MKMYVANGGVYAVTFNGGRTYHYINHNNSQWTMFWFFAEPKHCNYRYDSLTIEVIL